MISGRIAVPILIENTPQDNQPEFPICYDAEDGKVKSTSILKTTENTRKDSLKYLNLLFDNNVTAIVIKKIDIRSYMRFKNKGIDVFLGNKIDDTKFMIEKLISGHLNQITENQICGGKRRYTV